MMRWPRSHGRRGPGRVGGLWCDRGAGGTRTGETRARGAVSGGSAAGDRNRGIPVHFANAYTVALADADPGYAALFSAADAAVF